MQLLLVLSNSPLGSSEADLHTPELESGLDGGPYHLHLGDVLDPGIHGTHERALLECVSEATTEVAFELALILVVDGEYIRELGIMGVVDAERQHDLIADEGELTGEVWLLHGKLK